MEKHSPPHFGVVAIERRVFRLPTLLYIYIYLKNKASCGTLYTVKHILMECKNLTNTWREFYSIKKIRELILINRELIP